jgi:uronate dehydrogenase
VSRVIFASSNHVTGFYHVDEQVTSEMPYRPDSLYGLTKCWGELVGRLYADKYGLSSINLRIGNFNVNNRPESRRATRIWISNRDVVQLVVRCIELDADVKYLALYGTSANTRNWYEIDYLKDLIGYVPQDNGEDYVDSVPRHPDHDDIEFQGGGATRRPDG